MALSEFELIDRFFKNAFPDAPEVSCGIGDDAALVSVPPGQELALTMDTLVAGIHFPASATPADIGYKALAVNLSDLAAMGAEPRWITLSLTLPQDPEHWLEGFMSGFSLLAEKYALSLIGGDLARGPLSITLQLHGFVPAGSALRRSGARPGDRIYVSGTLGDAGLALGMLDHRFIVDEQHHAALLQRLHRPQPRVELGLALRGLATSAIDISDGLQADLKHILEASHAGAALNPERVPVSGAMQQLPPEQAWNLALTAGDDYELCFTLPASVTDVAVKNLAEIIPLQCIGHVTAQGEIDWRRSDGTIYKPDGAGYHHF